MPKVLVLFYSRTGSTAAVADAIAEGAETVKFAEVELRRIEDVAPESEIAADEQWKAGRAALARKYRTLESIESLTQYDALVVGGPVRAGMIAPELRSTLNQAASLASRGALVDKVGSAFAPMATRSGAADSAVMPLLMPLMHFGLIIVPPRPDPAAEVGKPSDAPAMTNELALARQLGARVAKVAEWVRHAKSHESHAHPPAQSHGHSHEHSHGHPDRHSH